MTTTPPKPVTLAAWELDALRDGRKTMFRVVVKPRPHEPPFQVYGDSSGNWFNANPRYPRRGNMMSMTWKPPHRVGDVLYVKERWCYKFESGLSTFEEFYYEARDGFIALDDGYGGTVSDNRGRERCAYQPARSMPPEAARYFLRIDSIKVERVRDIGRDGRRAADVMAEGITREQIEHQQKFFHPDDSPALAFANKWNERNGKTSWQSNPFVWVFTFTRIERPE